MNVAELSAAPGSPTAASRARPRRHPLLGGLLVKDRLINQAQLERVLALQERTEPRPLLGQLLVDQKLVTPQELNVVLGKYRRDHLLGDVLVETNLVTSSQLEAALAVQRRAGAPLGETLIGLGYITERQLKQALGIQLRIAFVDLDGRRLDRGLTALISERYARHHRVVPLSRSDDRIVVAMNDPTDVDVLAELRGCTGLRIDSVTATSGALERALDRLYGAPGEARRAEPDPGEATSHTPVAVTMPPAVALERTAGAPVIDAAPAGREAPAPPGPADGLQPRADSLRQRARSWEQWTDAVESLLRERLERRAEIERLARELREQRAALARTGQELEAKAQTLARLEAAHAALLQEHEALGRSLLELRERHEALLQERRFLIDRVAAALRRLRS
jgi:hypothetical protein